jgi:transcriptional regulator with XRE-family HTH domain
VFAQELRQLRKKSGLTQEEVGAKAGVSREYVSMLEAGKYTPTIDVFIHLCNAVSASPAEVIARLAKQIGKPPRR